MDELEFRRRIYAEPNSKDTELKHAAGEAPGRDAFWQELQALDAQIGQAAKIPVPDDLADRLLLQQNLVVHKQQKRRHRWQLAAAASVAFAVGLTFTLNQRTQNDLGTHALAHVAHEEGFVDTIDEGVTLTALNTKLAALGGRMDSMPGQIYYANFCDFDGIRSLHVVMGSEQGRVTLFYIPKEGNQRLPERFANDRYQGLGSDNSNVHMAVIGTEQQQGQLKPLMQQISNHYQSL
ncbi:DUF3379 family protein [Ferrimonas marina]|uniref:Transmembrane transcriptional regulator (Anti-sigma factor RsiW) n=1 Tax=Ferrimonas marina TaxID=299255 RepID=A0A1M5YA73_9GAMM|nr:DUF3379 family protein [Ferrimonas marina]SHI08980.1 Protein of unknown function [Ferrimonas marina]